MLFRSSNRVRLAFGATLSDLSGPSFEKDTWRFTVASNAQNRKCPFIYSCVGTASLLLRLRYILHFARPFFFHHGRAILLRATSSGCGLGISKQSADSIAKLAPRRLLAPPLAHQHGQCVYEDAGRSAQTFPGERGKGPVRAAGKSLAREVWQERYVFNKFLPLDLCS